MLAVISVRWVAKFLYQSFNISLNYMAVSQFLAFHIYIDIWSRYSWTHRLGQKLAEYNNGLRSKWQ